MSRPYYDENVVAEVRARADIVSVISDYVNLRKRGKNYVGLCPFHQEKTPSFTVDPDKQLFYCFGCGVGGNVFTFLMKKENMTFPEALETLARRTGVMLPSPTATSRKKDTEREAILKALEMAQGFFREMLFSKHGADALLYLKKRGLSREIIDLFGLGYAPLDWEFIVERGKKAGFDVEILHKAGLVIPRDNQEGSSPGGATRSGYYDRFRGRVTFPIYDARGRLIAFAGRSLGDQVPKYLNSPDTQVFHKGKELFALNLARSGIRKQGKVLLMEGYMDVITAFQAGFDYAVAGMGTALSQEQARTLMLLSEDVILCYDQDEAGRRAAQRNIHVFRDLGARTRVMLYQGAKDPDEFIRSFGKEKFLEVVDNAVPDVMFMYEMARENQDISSPEGKIKVKDNLVPFLASLESDFETSAYIEEIARRLGVKKEFLDKDVELYKRKATGELKYKKSENSNTTGYDNQLNTGRTASATSNVDPARRKAEEGIIRALIEKPELLKLKDINLDENDFADLKCKFAFSSLSQDPVRFFSDEEMSGWVSELCAKFGPISEPLRVIKDCIRKLKEIKAQELAEKIRQVQQGKDQSELAELVMRYQSLLKELKS